MYLHLIVKRVPCTEDSVLLQVVHGGHQRPIERGAGSLLFEQVAHAGPVESQHPAIDVAIHDVPPDAQQCLECHQTKSSGLLLLGRMIQSQFEVPRQYRPSLDLNFLLTPGKPLGMSRPMTLVTKCHRFASVGNVHGYGVVDSLVGILVDLPETEKNMVEFDHMMAFEILRGIASQTDGSLVPAYPVMIRFARPNALFKFADFLVMTHAHYTLTDEICTHANVNLHAQDYGPKWAICWGKRRVRLAGALYSYYRAYSAPSPTSRKRAIFFIFQQ